MSSNQQSLLMAGGDNGAPPVATCVADPYYDGAPGSSPHTILSLHGEAIADSSSDPKTLTNSGVTVSTAQSVFGGSSLYFSGSPQIFTTNITDFIFGSSDFTLEAWVYPLATTAQRIIVRSSTGGLYPFSLAISSAGKFAFLCCDNSSVPVAISSTTSVAIDRWWYLMCVRSGSNFYLFVDGVLEGSATFAGTLIENAVPLSIGSYNGGPEPFFGYLDDLRITRGVARETTAFTPPTMTFCDSETSASIDGTERLIGQALTVQAGIVKVANPWVKLSGIEIASSAGPLSPTLPNKTAVLAGTALALGQGTVLTSNKTVALTGTSAAVRNNGGYFGGTSFFIPPYPDFTRTLAPAGYGVTVSLPPGGGSRTAIVRLNLNQDGTLTIQVLSGTLVSETVRPAVWLYNSYAGAYDIATVANAYKLQEKSVTSSYGTGTVDNTIAMNNGADMLLGGYWEIEYTTLTNKPAVFEEVIVTSPKTINPRYGEVNYFGIFYFTFTITL